MITKEQRAARKSQGYNPKPGHPVCGNCAGMIEKDVVSRDDVGEWSHTVAWCSTGDFPTKRTATCRRHVAKDK